MKKPLALLSILLVQPLLAGPPTDAFEAFNKSATANDFDAAWKHVTQFEELPARVTEDLKTSVRNLVKLVSAGRKHRVVDEKVEGDCAVVVFIDNAGADPSTLDVDPAFLLKQGDEWKVFPGITRWDLAESVAKDKVEAFKRLEAWYKTRKTELMEEHYKPRAGKAGR